MSDQTPESDGAGEYDGTVREIPFNQARQMLDGEADELMATARKQLYQNYQRKGDGWQYEDARYHFWKGIDELYSACHAVKQGDIETMEKRIADGWNHILMASYVAYSDTDQEGIGNDD